MEATFPAMVTLLNGETKKFSFPTTFTVDHVKRAIFGQSSSLKGLDPNNYRIGLETGQFHVEFKKLCTLPEVEALLQQTGESLHLKIYKRDSEDKNHHPELIAARASQQIGGISYLKFAQQNSQLKKGSTLAATPEKPTVQRPSSMILTPNSSMLSNQSDCASPSSIGSPTNDDINSSSSILSPGGSSTSDTKRRRRKVRPTAACDEEPAPGKSNRLVKGICVYDGAAKNSLSIQLNELIWVSRKDATGWWLGRKGTVVGWFPSNFVQWALEGDEIVAEASGSPRPGRSKPKALFSSPVKVPSAIREDSREDRSPVARSSSNDDDDNNNNNDNNNNASSKKPSLSINITTTPSSSSNSNTPTAAAVAVKLVQKTPGSDSDDSDIDDSDDDLDLPPPPISTDDKTLSPSPMNQSPMCRSRSASTADGMTTPKRDATTKLRVTFPDGNTSTVDMQRSWTVEALKKAIINASHDRVKMPAGIPLSSDYFALKVHGSEPEAFVAELDLVENVPALCGDAPSIILVDRLSDSKREFDLHVSTLLDYDINPNPQVQDFRHAMSLLRKSKVLHADVQEFPVFLASATTQPLPSKFVIKVSTRSENGQIIKGFNVTAGMTANEVIDDACNRCKTILPPTAMGCDYVLKVPGYKDFITGTHRIVDFSYVRKMLVTNEAVTLSLIPRYPEGRLTREGSLDQRSSRRYSSVADMVQSNAANRRSSLLKEHSIDIQNCFSISDAFSWQRTSKAPLNGSFMRPLRLRIHGVENISMERYSRKPLGRCLYIEAGLYFGGELLCIPRKTKMTAFQCNPSFLEWVTFDLNLCDIPLGTRLCCTVLLTDRKDPTITTPILGVSYQLFDHLQVLRSGIRILRMWDDRANPIGICCENLKSENPAEIYLEFEKYAIQLVYQNPAERYKMQDMGETPQPPTLDEEKILREVFARGPLAPISPHHCALLWKYRVWCSKFAKALPKFLKAVNWGNAKAVFIAHKMLDQWAPIPPTAALELLDSLYSDFKVRNHAVTYLDRMDDTELGEYLLQLVQVLKYEPYHDSSLARFLLERSARNRAVGHTFFWYLKSEMKNLEISERYGLYLETYLHSCGQYRKDLFVENSVLQQLVRVALLIKKTPSQDRMKVLKQELEVISMELPSTFQLPLSPRLEAKGIIVEKCRYMDSKKLPLFLRFCNADPDGEDIQVILKVGDDLRQDMLTLQMIRIMDELWRQHGLDFRLKPYGCIATGEEQGMLEVVKNAETVAAIQREYGGVMGAFKVECVKEWLYKNKIAEQNEQDMLATFCLSCAGYAVATLVLGIGDRHNDNIMVTKFGHLFHIDFGHFLGNFKSKFGVKRERSPFVFTPDFAYVMGGKGTANYKIFEDFCCKAYNILRKQSHVFINLFAMMLSTGIPELQKPEDLQYLIDVLNLGEDDDSSAKKIRLLIDESLNCVTTRANFTIHLIAH